MVLSVLQALALLSFYVRKKKSRNPPTGDLISSFVVMIVSAL